MDFTTKLDGLTVIVYCNGDRIGRILPLGNAWHGKHDNRHEGGIFPSLNSAVEYVQGVEHRILNFGVLSAV
jgi:hypothetical protein